MSDDKIYIKNKKAYFEYIILDKYVAGIKLLGTEIKSIRDGKANVNDAFCTFIGGQLYVRNLHIAEYSFGSFYNHEAKRDRVLLLNKKELKKLLTRGEEKGHGSGGGLCGAGSAGSLHPLAADDGCGRSDD